MQQIGRGALIVLQSMLAVAFGAGLFIAFDELWKWNNIVALVLSVLVILGLVVGVRMVRKTEDIGEHADRGGGRSTGHSGSAGVAAIGLGGPGQPHCAPSHQGRSVDGLGISDENRGGVRVCRRGWATTVSS